MLSSIQSLQSKQDDSLANLSNSNYIFIRTYRYTPQFCYSTNTNPKTQNFLFENSTKFTVEIQNITSKLGGNVGISSDFLKNICKHKTATCLKYKKQKRIYTKY